MSRPLREEIAYWKFLDSWTGHVCWRSERHALFSLESDASGSGWGGVIHLYDKDVIVRDYWSPEDLSLNISTKETLAVVRLLEVAPPQVKDCRIDLNTDSQVLIDTWHKEGSRSQELSDATKALFTVVSQRNLHLQLFHVSSDENAADGPSRCLSKSDSMLSPQAWSRIQAAFGGTRGHTLDLMALDSNTQRNLLGEPLPHFTPFASKESAGVNLFAQYPDPSLKFWENPFVFPPFTWLTRFCGSCFHFSSHLPSFCRCFLRFRSGGQY